MTQCPCNSGLNYADCCEPIIGKVAKASTAEQLMRARYTSYATGNIDFIMTSHDPKTLDTVNEEATREWSESANWLGLDIRNVEKGTQKDQDGIVEFVASFELEGKRIDHHEKAYFQKQDGDWYFMDSQILQDTYVRPNPKVGRNEPCTCGSGRKFKHCCGK